MAFTDRLVEYPNRYTMTDASGNTSTVYLEPAPGEVTQGGTLLNAENLNSEVAALAPGGYRRGVRQQQGTPT